MTAGGSGAPSDPSPKSWSSGPRSEEPADSPGGRFEARRSSNPSGRSITDLELAFAQSPESDVYVELCEAYLSKQRFMEAMVVCKKASRTNPEAWEPKLMLARVHEAQGKLQRALDVLEGLAKGHPDEAEVWGALGRVKLARGDDQTAVEALKRALDLDPALTDTSALLESRGVVYPEPPPAPAPPPEVPEATPSVEGGAPSQDPQTAALGPSAFGAGPTDTSWALPSSPAPATGPEPSFAPPSGPVHPVLSGLYAVPVPAGSGVYRVPPQRLEGEDELERMAQEVAEEAPPRGRAVTTVLLLVALLVTGALVVGLRLSTKARLEAIDALRKEATAAFDRDLYASYKVAADALEEVLEQYDARHEASLAMLAHVYAILATEHLETSVAARLEDVLTRAEVEAPDDPHTRAARGLVQLWAGSDRSESAAQAETLLVPFAAEDQSSVPSYIDLSLAITERELGYLDRAHQRLQRVADFLGNNVRARVWSARAAASAGRLATANRSFIQAQKAEPRHPGVLTGLALVTLARGNPSGAAQALQRFEELEQTGSRDISPKDRALASFAKSELLRRDGDEGAADHEYEQAVRLDPDNAEFPFQRGTALLDRDRVAGAVEYIGKAIEMEPYRWTFRVEMAEAEMRAKRYERARSNLDFALERAPKELEVALAQARYLRRTKAPEAEAYLTEELPARFPAAKVEIGLELGRFYRAAGELDKADNELAEAIKAFGGRSQSLQSDVLVSFGLVAHDSGRRDEAIKAYRAAARRGNLDALALLASLLQGGTAKERSEALQAGRRYLAAGRSLRRTDFVKAVVSKLGGS